jgi:phage repressor protein C with HTH and peptisase S24 domain
MFTYLNNKIKESQLPYYLNHDKQIEEKSSRSKEVGEEKIAGNNRIPFYDISISGGTLNFFNDYNELPSTTLEIPFMSDCDLALPVYGDSMHPVIKNGDIVLLKKIHNKSVLLYGEIYLVVTEDYRTLKYIRRNQDKELISLVSANENFDTVTIKKTAILQLYIYKGKFEKSQI